MKLDTNLCWSYRTEKRNILAEDDTRNVNLILVTPSCGKQFSKYDYRKTKYSIYLKKGTTKYIISMEKHTPHEVYFG
jgi:hypothetical protein